MYGAEDERGRDPADQVFEPNAAAQWKPVQGGERDGEENGPDRPVDRLSDPEVVYRERNAARGQLPVQRLGRCDSEDQPAGEDDHPFERGDRPADRGQGRALGCHGSKASARPAGPPPRREAFIPIFAAFVPSSLPILRLPSSLGHEFDTATTIRRNR